MGSMKKRAEGAAQEVGGQVKKNVGRLLGDAAMENKGAAKEAQGKGKQEIAKAGERLKGTAEKIKGSLRRAVNK